MTDAYPCDIAVGYGLVWGAKGDVISIERETVLDSIEPRAMADATGQSSSMYTIGRLACVGWSIDAGGCAALVAGGGPSTWTAMPAATKSMKCRPSPSRAKCTIPQTRVPVC